MNNRPTDPTYRPRGKRITINLHPVIEERMHALMELLRYSNKRQFLSQLVRDEWERRQPKTPPPPPAALSWTGPGRN